MSFEGASTFNNLGFLSGQKGDIFLNIGMFEDSTLTS